eukprot:SAG22_NODE_298_length_12785_cov_5.760129_5_plen_470_part_00
MAARTWDPAPVARWLRSVELGGSFLAGGGTLALAEFRAASGLPIHQCRELFRAAAVPVAPVSPGGAGTASGSAGGRLAVDELYAFAQLLQEVDALRAELRAQGESSDEALSCRLPVQHGSSQQPAAGAATADVRVVAPVPVAPDTSTPPTPPPPGEQVSRQAGRAGGSSSARQVRAGAGGSSSARAVVCLACENLLLADASFCRKCGRARAQPPAYIDVLGKLLGRAPTELGLRQLETELVASFGGAIAEVEAAGAAAMAAAPPPTAAATVTGGEDRAAAAVRADGGRVVSAAEASRAKDAARRRDSEARAADRRRHEVPWVRIVPVAAWSTASIEFDWANTGACSPDDANLGHSDLCVPAQKDSRFAVSWTVHTGPGWSHRGAGLACKLTVSGAHADCCVWFSVVDVVDGDPVEAADGSGSPPAPVGSAPALLLPPARIVGEFECAFETPAGRKAGTLRLVFDNSRCK